ncbi:MAG: glycosyltransferase family 9 protein, partial [Flavobacterium sp.]
FKYSIRLKKAFSNLMEYLKVWFTLKIGAYDVVINVDKNSSSGRLSTKFTHSKWKFFGEDDEQFFVKYPDGKHMAKFSVYMLRNELEKCGVKPNVSPVPYLDLKLSKEEIANGEKVLHSIVPADKKAICIYTFATGTKCYSEEWWLDFYEKLKSEFADYHIFEMLPIENISKINRKAPVYYSKDIREMGAVIANSAIFIGADCGVMHLASAALTPTIGLFSVTSIDKYQPYNPGSVSVYTDKTDSQTLLAIIRNTLTQA